MLLSTYQQIRNYRNYKMLNFMNACLQKIKCSKGPFGGVIVIAIGNVYQLKPVQDGYIF